jgi:hypothetical protein
LPNDRRASEGGDCLAATARKNSDLTEMLLAFPNYLMPVSSMSSIFVLALLVAGGACVILLIARIALHKIAPPSDD